MNGFYNPVLINLNVTLFWLVDAVQWILIPAITIYCLKAFCNITPTMYGFKFNYGFFQFIIITVFVTLSLYIAFFVVRNNIKHYIGYSSPAYSLPNAYPAGILGTITWLYTAISAGIIESLFFIGLPWLLWCRAGFKSKLIFVLLMSTIFASAHWEYRLHVVIAAFSLQIVALLWYFRINTLWPIILGHTIIDLIALS